MRLILLISDQNDTILLNADFLASRLRVIQVCQLSDQHLGPRVPKLECQLINCVAWVGWGQDASSPVHSPCYGRCINAIGCIESKDIAAPEVIIGTEAFAEIEGRGAYLGISIGSLGVRVDVDY